MSVIPHGEGDARSVRLICNRDEQRSRRASLPATLRSLGPRRALMPIDPTSGGTWVGVNDAGVIACLLNASDGSRDGTLSRGSIVPAALEECTPEAAARRVSCLDARRFQPFRLLLLDAVEHRVLRSDGRTITPIAHGPVISPIMLTSSGLGDELVQAPRRGLFARLMLEPGRALEHQAVFHLSRDHAAGELGVLMCRPDARTVSQTIIDLTPTGASLRCLCVDEGMTPDDTAPRLRLERRRPEHGHNA